MNPRPLIRCDCKVINGGTNYYAERIVFCPLHASAEKLLDALKGLVVYGNVFLHKATAQSPYEKAIDAIEDAEAKR